MKSEKGITITAIMIYVVALTVVVLLMGRVITYFYKNVKSIDEEVSADIEYTKFNSYFTEEINIEGNDVHKWEKNYIVFKTDQNQYTQFTFENGSIYRGQVKIAKNIDFCEFYYNENTKEIFVNIKIQGKYYSSTYTVAK